jgi:hypothetical protein
MNRVMITISLMPFGLSLLTSCGEFPLEMVELEIAQASVAEGDFEEGRAGLELVPATYPGTVESAVSLHTQGLIAGQYDDDPYTAVELIEQAEAELNLDPKLPPVLISRLRIRMQFDKAIYQAAKGDCGAALENFNAMRKLELESILEPTSFVAGYVAAGDCSVTIGDNLNAVKWYEDGSTGMDESLVNVYGIPLELKLAGAISGLNGLEAGVRSLDHAWLDKGFMTDEKRPLIKLEQSMLYGAMPDVQGQIAACHAAIGAVETILSANEDNDQLWLFEAVFALRALEELQVHYTSVGLKEEALAAGQAHAEMLEEVAEMMSGS